jgi:hypothetical protein
MMATQPAFAHLPPRAAIKAAIETLLCVIDTLDGDPDLEVDDHSEEDDHGGTDLDRGEGTREIDC